jgi:hypothetical protein
VSLSDLKRPDQRSPKGSERLRVTWRQGQILNGRKGTTVFNVTESFSWKRDMSNG